MIIQRDLTMEDYILILRRRWPLIALLTVLGGGLGLATAHFMPKRFTSQTLVLISQPTVPGDYVKSVVNEDINQRLAAMQEQILSRARLEPVIRQLGIFDKDVDQVSMELLVARLRKMITVTPIQPMAQTRSAGLPGFTVSVDYSDPRLAQQICSTITSLFMAQNSQVRQEQAEQTTRFLSSQLEDAKAKLDEQDAKLAVFQRRYIGSLPEQEGMNLNMLTGLASQLDATTQALGRAQQDKTFAESMLTQQLADWQSAQQATQDGKNPESSALQLAAMQVQLGALKARYTDSHPDVIKLNNDILSLKASIAENNTQQELPNGGADKLITSPNEPPQIHSLRVQVHQHDQSIKELTARQERIQEQIKIYQDRVQSSPAVEQEYKLLTRDYQTALEFYNELLKKRNQSAMATDLERQQEGEQFQVLDPANFPAAPSFPKQANFALGGLGGGLALGLAVAFLFELKDTSVRSEKDIEFLLHLPVVAAIPTVKALMSKSPRDASFRAVLRT